ncbi:MAG: glycosyltransferase [Candidatus Pseudothioglobus sp.]
MKIAVIIRNFKRSAGGAERYCVELTERLALNHEVHVFSQNYEINQAISQFHKIPKYFEKPRFINQLIFSWLTRKETLGNFDIVHSHEMISHANIYTIHVPCFRSILLNLSGVTKVLNYFYTLLSPRKLGYLWLENQQMCQKSCKHYIVVSELLQRNLNECYPLVKNISIAYPAINNQVLKSDFSQVNKALDLREKFAIPNSAFIMLLVANNFKKKGCQLYLSRSIY